VNDFDVDSNTITAIPETGISQLGGTFRIFADGSISYDPTTSLTLRSLNDGQSADDQFTYRITDEQGAQTTGRVTVTVTGITDPPYQNPVWNADVTGDGFLSPLDALTLINYINANGVGLLPPGRTTPPFLDPDGDNAITPSDVILVINALNDQADNPSVVGEGEAAEDLGAVAQPLSGLADSPVTLGIQTIVVGSVDPASVAASGSQWTTATASPLASADAVAWNSIDSATVADEPATQDAQRVGQWTDVWDEDESLDEIAQAASGASRYEDAVDEVFSELFR
jgi:VCBS repeat-containing protein